MSPPLTAFLKRAAAFLEGAIGRAPAAVPPRAWGEGPDDAELLAEQSSEQERELLAAARGFKALEYDAGFGWIDGPVEYAAADDRRRELQRGVPQRRAGPRRPPPRG